MRFPVRFERDQHFPAPALDPADTARAGARLCERQSDLAGRKLLDERPDQAHRLEQLLEAHQHARATSPRVWEIMRGSSCWYGRGGVVDAQIALDAARPAGEPVQAQALGELGQDLPVMMKRSCAPACSS